MVYMLLGTGFEETEAIAPLDLLRRAGIETKTVGLNGKTIVGSHGIPVVTDMEIAQLDISDAEMVVLPGGSQGVASILNCPAALQAVEQTWKDGKFVAAICAGPTVLAKLGITDGVIATCYPGCEKDMGKAIMVLAPAVLDGKVITGTSAGCAVSFGLALIGALRGPEAARAVENQIVIR